MASPWFGSCVLWMLTIKILIHSLINGIICSIIRIDNHCFKFYHSLLCFPLSRSSWPHHSHSVWSGVQRGPCSRLDRSQSLLGREHAGPNRGGRFGRKIQEDSDSRQDWEPQSHRAGPQRWVSSKPRKMFLVEHWSFVLVFLLPINYAWFWGYLQEL